MHPAGLTPNFAFKIPSLKAVREFGSFEPRLVDLCLALQLTFLCSEVQHFDLFGLTDSGTHELQFRFSAFWNNMSIRMCILFVSFINLMPFHF